MTILYPVFFFYPDNTGGGPTNTVYWQSKALIKKEISVIVVTTNHGITTLPVDTWLNTEYGQIIYLKTAFPKWSIRLLICSIRQLPKVDIVHLNSFFYPPALLIVLYAIFLKKKVVWSPRGELAPEALAFGSRIKFLFLFLIKRFRKKIVFHTTSTEEFKILRSRLGEDNKVLLIPNLMELPKKIPKLDFNNNQPYLLFIGRLHPIKGIENLIAALSLSIAFKKSNIRLKIAGSGDLAYIQNLKSRITHLKLDSQIDWLGHVDGEEKERILSAALATVLPSFSENFGVVVIETLAQSTPVIASKNTPWEILEKCNAGYWIDNSPEKLSEAIDNIAFLPYEEYKQVCQNARRLVEEEFDVVRKIDIWIDSYNEICA